MTEDELFGTLDGGDPEALLVCADWHEGNGDTALAELLRLEHRLRTKPRPRNLLELGATVAPQAAASPERWIAKLAPHSPIGNWDGIDSDRQSWGFEFHADHKLSYARSGGRYHDGEWMQVGSLVLMSTNKKFTTYVGLVFANQIIGAAKTIHDLAWTWEVMRVDAPKPAPKLRPRSPGRARRAELQRATRAVSEAARAPRNKKAATKAKQSVRAPAAKKPAAKQPARKLGSTPTQKRPRSKKR